MSDEPVDAPGPDAEDPEAQLRTAVAGPSEDTVPAVPAVQGPRRRVLIAVGALVFGLLLWSLFRSGTNDEPVPGGRTPQTTGEAAVVDMANEADPSWMRSTDTAITGASRTPIPPVYAPVSEGALGYPNPGDSANATPASPETGDAGGEQSPPPDPRREAFRTALRSRPVLASAAFVAPPPTDSTGGVAGAPDLTAMESAAHAEADRRSAPPQSLGSGLPSDSSLPFPGSGSTRISRSSYATGGMGPAPQGASPQVMTSRAGGGNAVWIVPVGTIIEGQLHTAVNSDLPGSVVGMVTRNVYDATQRHVVIPRFSWLFGTYESDVATGQARLVVQWTALRFPSGETYELPALRAGDRAGASGLSGRVNNHYGTVFGHAVLSSIIGAGVQISAGDDDDNHRSPRETIAEATAQQLGQTASEVTRRNLQIKPTITVPRLTRFSVILDRDLVFTGAPR